MNWIERLVVKALPNFSKSFSFAPTWARYAFSKTTNEKLIREGYKANSAVSACATTLQLTFPEPPLLAGYEEEGRFVPDYKHAIMPLVRRPNPDMGLVELLQFAIAYASIGGNAYLWKQRSANGKMLALWPFSDVQISPIAGHDTSEGFVAYYEYDAGDGKKIPISKDNIIHWKWMVDPQNPWRGIGAIELSAREVDRDNEATAYIFALLKNNAVPPIVITLTENDELTTEKADRLRKEWFRKYGAESRGGPAFLESGMKAEQLGFDLNKLAAETLADVPETRIAANFHVPPSVAGLNVGVKRSDYGDTAARKAFTEQTLMALWRSLASEMLNGLKDEYPGTPDNFVLWFDVRNVGALQEQKKDQWERVTLAFNRSLLTRAEAKQELGMKALPGDEVYFISLASEFVTVSGQRSAPQAGSSTDSGQQDSSSKSQAPGEKSRTGGQALQRIRLDVARRMTQAVDVYFSQLADRVVERAGKNTEGGIQKARGNGQLVALKALPRAGELVNADDRKKLEALIKRFYVEVIELSWGTWNYVLGVEKAFDLTDPIVSNALQSAATRVKEINDTTMEEIRKALIYGNENGWSVDQLVRGDENQPGLRDIVDETYKNRARTIARTELAEAQNNATAARYKDAGIGLVEILDNGASDDDPECQTANGQIWTLEYFSGHTLEHPNCTRAAAPYFGDAKPDRG